jgi:hypothetical protein
MNRQKRLELVEGKRAVSLPERVTALECGQEWVGERIDSFAKAQEALAADLQKATRYALGIALGTIGTLLFELLRALRG